MVGVEVLLCWMSFEFGLMLLVEFILVVEDMGLIVVIG